MKQYWFERLVLDSVRVPGKLLGCFCGPCCMIWFVYDAWKQKLCSGKLIRTVYRKLKICNSGKSKMLSSQEWRLEIQTHHRDRKATTFRAAHKVLACNFGFSGEFWLGTNDPGEMSLNLSTQIENLSCQHRQICRKTVITRLGSRKRASSI